MINPYFPTLTNTAAPFRCALATVDIALVNIATRQLLLGRKPKDEKFRFFGGFVDPELDKSVMQAAKRELREEAGDIEADEFIIISQPLVNDSRYTNDKDKIFTTLFAAKYIFGRPEATDDLKGGEVKWFKIAELTKNDVIPCHQPLMEAFLNFYNDNARLKL